MPIIFDIMIHEKPKHLVYAEDTNKNWWDAKGTIGIRIESENSEIVVRH